MKIQVQAFDRTPGYDPRRAEHFWVLVAAYHVDPATWSSGDQLHLDRENLVSLGAIGCLHCEQLYSERLAQRRCPGDPV